jgi:curved DNA-binding protein CbpA
MTLYEILGLTPEATPKQIKSAWRVLAQKHHPDKQGDPEAFKAIQTAYDVLSDPERRAQYDATGETKEAPTLRYKALTLLPGLVEQVIKQNDADTEDLIEAARHYTTAEIIGQQRQQHAFNQQITKCEKVLKRLKFEGKGEDMVAQVINQKLDHLRGGLAAFVANIEIYEEVLVILEDYKYTKDVKVDPWLYIR